MANNQLIQGASKVNKEFLDVAEAVGQGFAMSQGNTGGQRYVNPRVAENKAIQNRVNKYMDRMKTDQDFTGFSKAETSSMRSFLMEKRMEYAAAAKIAASSQDNTSDEYLEAVDIMQGVNNSFTNLASSLESYKKGKLDYAQGQRSGSFSDGADPVNASDTAAMYGFYDDDDDPNTKDIGGKDAAFKISSSGDLSFDINGKNISYNQMTPLPLKDFKLGISLLKGNEAAYSAGQRQTSTSLDLYRMQLEEALQNPDSVQSMIFDFNDEMETTDLQDGITSGALNIDQARDIFIDRMVNSRNEVSLQGYNRKVQQSQAAYNLSQQRKIDAAAKRQALKDARDSSKNKTNTTPKQGYTAAELKAAAEVLNIDGKEASSAENMAAIKELIDKQRQK